MRVLPNCVLALVLLVLLSSPWIAAQHSGGGGSKAGGAASPAANPGSIASYDPKSTGLWFDSVRITSANSPDQHLKNEQPSCFEWPMAPVVSAVVSVKGLDIPVPVRDNFREACAAVMKKDLANAQRELNHAVKQLPKFAPGWVLLGQIQKDEKKIEQAQQSCMEAHNADTSYLPAYLCLADLAARQSSWTRTAEWTNQALDLHPVRAPGAYYLNALAFFYLGQAPQAEKSALRALEEGGQEQKPPLHWLLAKIYEAKGDRAAEAEQLREYLKVAPHAQDAPVVRKILQQIESTETTPSATTARPPS